MAMGADPYMPPDDGVVLHDRACRPPVKFQQKHAEANPFFLFFHRLPHWPLHAKPEDIEKYVGRRSGLDELRRSGVPGRRRVGICRTLDLSPRTRRPAGDETEDKALWERRMEVYAAMIDSMDQGIGNVVNTIRSLGKLDNTLILFLSDNGGCHESADIEQGTPRNTWGDPNAMPGDSASFDGYDRPWANASNTPLRMFKSWVHEGGISSPLVCHWPDGIKVPAGSITDSPGHVIDLMATCLDLSGAEYPQVRDGVPITPLEGKSLRPIFETGAREGHEAIFWEHQGNRAMRMGQWKLVSKRGGSWELYDLDADRAELRDLSTAMPGRVAEMDAAWLDWGKKVGWVPFNELGR